MIVTIHFNMESKEYGFKVTLFCVVLMYINMTW